MPRPRRTCTKAFKIEAVRLVTDGGRRVTEVARGDATDAVSVMSQLLVT
jgi:transposase-like protein